MAFISSCCKHSFGSCFLNVIMSWGFTGLVGVDDGSTFIFYVTWMSMCYVDDRIFHFAQICHGSDSSDCFLAISSPIHFFSRCSPDLDGLSGTFPTPPTGLPQDSCDAGIQWGLFGGPPHQLAHTVPAPLGCHSVQTSGSLLVQIAPMQGLGRWTDFTEDLEQQCKRVHYRNAKHFKLNIRHPRPSKFHRATPDQNSPQGILPHAAS